MRCVEAVTEGVGLREAEEEAGAFGGGLGVQGVDYAGAVVGLGGGGFVDLRWSWSARV